MTSRTRRRTAAVTAAGLTLLTATLSACGGQEAARPASPVVTLSVPPSPPSDAEPTLEPTPAPTPQPTPDSGPPPGAGAPADPAPGAGPPAVIETVATGLRAPWGLAFLPDGDAIVTERDSTRVLRIAAEDRSVSEVGRIDLAAPGGEGGLLGVAVSPDYASDSTLYFYATTEQDNRVVRARLDGRGRGSLGPVRDVLTGIPDGQIHDGGRLVFGPDGLLYVSTGEIGVPELAADPGSLGGKVLRVTATGEPAPGNPSGDEVYSLGHRNVQGLAFDPDGRLWASEFGQNTFDELNRIEAGADYGWPEVEGSAPDVSAERGYTEPQATWSTDEASPSGLAYAGGSLWMAALRGSRLWQVPLRGESAGRPRAHFVGDYGRMRTVVPAPDGTLWVTTSNTDGRGDPAGGDDRILVVRP